MSARDPTVLLAPDGTEDEIVVSKKGIAELRRQAEAQAKEIE